MSCGPVILRACRAEYLVWDTWKIAVGGYPRRRPAESVDLMQAQYLSTSLPRIPTLHHTHQPVDVS